MNNNMVIGTVFCLFLGCSNLAINNNNDHSNKKAASRSAAVSNDYDSFDSLVNNAFDQGVLDKPIIIKKPSRFQRFLRAFGVPLAMKLVALKQYIQRKLRKLWNRGHAKA